MNEPKLFGLSEPQMDWLEGQYLRQGDTVRPAPPVRRPSGNGGGGYRVMIHAEDFPKYSPRRPREVVVFDYEPDLDTQTFEFFGQNLEGYVTLTIDGTSYVVRCNATTENLRSIVELPSNVGRITVLPGLWEFAFKNRTGPVVEISPGYQFDGGIVKFDDAWRTIPEGKAFETVEVVDGLPFLEGSVKRGAMGITQQLTDGSLAVPVWSCRHFSFKNI